MVTKKTKWTKDVALEEMKRWCAADEKSHFHVRTKLIEHQVYGDDLEDIITELIQENFLNETRYASAYVSGKLKINEWGRKKIIFGLKQKYVSSYNIQKAIQSIDEELYQSTLEKLFEFKARGLKLSSKNDQLKIYKFLEQRGFESELIHAMLAKHK
jgi:regulatory protein